MRSEGVLTSGLTGNVDETAGAEAFPGFRLNIVPWTLLPRLSNVRGQCDGLVPILRLFRAQIGLNRGCRLGLQEAAVWRAPSRGIRGWLKGDFWSRLRGGVDQYGRSLWGSMGANSSADADKTSDATAFPAHRFVAHCCLVSLSVQWMKALRAIVERSSSRELG
jgi:hypothetical protein